MLDLGPHAGFIIAAYSISAITLMGLTAWIIYNERRRQNALDKLEN